MSKTLTDAKRKAIQKYDAVNTKQYHLKLNVKTDADIIERLSGQTNVQGYLKDVIRAEMASDVKTRLREVYDREQMWLFLCWLARFCRHIDNGDQWLTDEENFDFFKKKMSQQFGWKTDGMTLESY